MKNILLPLSICCSLLLSHSISLACTGFKGSWTCQDGPSKIFANIRGFETTAVIEQRKEEFVMGTFVIDGGLYIIANGNNNKTEYSGQCLNSSHIKLKITQEFINFGRSTFVYTLSDYNLMNENQMNLTIEQSNTMSPQVKKRTIPCTK